MKVKHSVEVSTEEVTALTDIIEVACLAEYSSVEAQNVALLQAKVEFEAKLNELVKEAFKFGRKIGKAKADYTDTEMYK